MGDERWQAFSAKTQALEAANRTLKETHLHPGSDLATKLSRLTNESLSKEVSLDAFLRRPGVSASAVAGVLPELDAACIEQLAVEYKYAGYIERQSEEIERIRRHEKIALPENMDYAAMEGLSAELTEKLLHYKPQTLARAARIPGMTPAALSLLLVHERKNRHATAVAGVGG